VTAQTTAAAHWQRAVEIRREWLGWGLSTKPAEREAAEAALTTLYARLRRPRPRFVWVDSPHLALPLVAGLPTLADLHGWVMAPPSRQAPPLASDLAASASRLRGALDACHSRPDFDPRPPKRGKPPLAWPVLPAADLLRAGVPFREILRQGVRAALSASLAFHSRVRAELGPPESLPVCWYGQQDAPWIAYYDAWRRLGLAHYFRADEVLLDAWATLARSCGWWWPDEAVCVIVERPAAIHVEPVPRAFHEEVRLRDDGGPPVAYRG